MYRKGLQLVQAGEGHGEACLIEQGLVDAAAAEGFASQERDQGPQRLQRAPPAPGCGLLRKPADTPNQSPCLALLLLLPISMPSCFRRPCSPTLQLLASSQHEHMAFLISGQSYTGTQAVPRRPGGRGMCVQMHA